MFCSCPLCTGGSRDEIAGQVAEHGWHLTAVLPSNGRPGWAYSVGLWHTFRHPEVAIFGLPPGRNGLVNVAAEVVREGRQLTPGGVLSEVLIGYPMSLRLADPAWSELFPGLAEFYSASPVPVVQLVWPDQDGRFPWDRGFDECFRESQPLLWLAADDHPPGEWLRVLRSAQASQRQR